MTFAKATAALSLVVWLIVTCTGNDISERFHIDTDGYCSQKCAVALRESLRFAEGGKCVVQRLGDSPTQPRSWLVLVCEKEQALDEVTAAIAMGDEAKLQGISIALIEQDRNMQLFENSVVPYGVDQADGVRDGASCPRRFNKLGEGTNVWVIDSGCTPSPGGSCANFSNGTWARGCTDELGHGTFVGGTATDTKYGVASEALLNCIRVVHSNGFMTAGDIALAILYVRRNRKGGDVINLSLGGPITPSLDHVVRDVADSGVYFAIASGNSRIDSCRISPARAAEGGYPRIFSVAAHDESYKAYAFSNAGPCTTISAPGVAVKSITVDGSTIIATGTSFASPHVAGAMAVLLSNNREPTLKSLTASTPAGLSKIGFTFNYTSGIGSSKHPFLAYACSRCF